MLQKRTIPAATKLSADRVERSTKIEACGGSATFETDGCENNPEATRATLKGAARANCFACIAALTDTGTTAPAEDFEETTANIAARTNVLRNDVRNLYNWGIGAGTVTIPAADVPWTTLWATTPFGPTEWALEAKHTSNRNGSMKQAADALVALGDQEEALELEIDLLYNHLEDEDLWSEGYNNCPCSSNSCRVCKEERAEVEENCGACVLCLLENALEALVSFNENSFCEDAECWEDDIEDCTCYALSTTELEAIIAEAGEDFEDFKGMVDNMKLSEFERKQDFDGYKAEIKDLKDCKSDCEECVKCINEEIEDLKKDIKDFQEDILYEDGLAEAKHLHENALKELKETMLEDLNELDENGSENGRATRIKEALITQKGRAFFDNDGKQIAVGNKPALTSMGAIMVLGVTFVFVGVATILALMFVRAPKKEEQAPAKK